MKRLAIAIIVLLLATTFAITSHSAEEVEKIEVISGLRELKVTVAIPSILDILSNITVVVVVQRPDTYEFVDPQRLTVTLSFMGFKMAEKNITDMRRVSKGIYVAYFKPVGIPLLLDISAEAEWVTPWGERVRGETKTNVLVDFFYNITGRLKQFFQQFFQNHNITAYLHGLYENFTSTFSKWVDAFKRFATIVRLTFGNLFSLKKKAYSKVVVLNITDLDLITTWNGSTEAEILSILQKARLVPSIQVVNSLSEFYSILFNKEEINVILVNLGKYFPIPQLNKSWEEELRNLTVTMASKHWRVLLFEEPFRFLYNGTYLNVGSAGWNITLQMSGVVLWGDVPQYTVITDADLAGTTLIDKILAEFNVSIPYSAKGTVIAVPDTLATDYAYSVVGTSLVAMFRIDAPTGLSIVVGIPSMFWRSLLFGIGLIGWQIHEFFARVLDILKNEIAQAIYGLPFYSQLQDMIANLENLLNGNYNASAIFNEILNISEWLVKVLVNPWQIILGGLGGEFTSTESAIAEQNEDIYYAAGAYSDVVVSTSDVESQILQHVQALYVTTMFGMLDNLPHLVATAVDEAKKGHWSGSVNTTEAFLEPALYEDEFSAEDAIKLANETIQLVYKMLSNSTKNNPYLNVTTELLTLLDNASKLLTEILNLLEGNLTLFTSGVRIAGILDVVWGKINKLWNTVNQLQTSLGNLWSSIGSLTSGVTSLFSRISSIWNYLYNFAGQVKNWINAAKQALQQAMSQAIANVKDWVRNYVYEPLKRFVGSAINGLTNAFSNFRKWVLREISGIRSWVLSKIELMKQEIAELWNYVKAQLVDPLIEGAKAFIRDARDAILAFGNYIKNSLTWLWDRIKDVASNIITFFRNLPDFIINALREYGAAFLRISWKIIKASVQYVFERVLSAFGINYNRLVGALRSIWSAIFKVVDFVKNALTAIPNLISNFAGRLKEMVNTIVEFIKSAFANATQLIDNLFSKFSNITRIFNTFAGFLGQAKAFVQKLLNVTTWLSVIKYALHNLKQKTETIVRQLTSTAGEALKLGNAYKGENIRIVAVRGTAVYFMYEDKGRFVRDTKLKITVADSERVYGYAIASEIAPTLYVVDLKSLNLKPDHEYILIAEKFEVGATTSSRDPEPPTAVATTLYISSVKPATGIAGSLVVKAPKTLYADRPNYITVTIENEMNAYAEVDLSVTLVKNKIPLSYYGETVKVSPVSNTTRTLALGPFYLVWSGRAVLRVTVKHPAGTTTVELEVELKLGPFNYMLLAGAGIVMFITAYSFTEILRMKHKK